MNGKLSDDQLSAYFDDELTLEERAVVEQELAASPELRAELNSYRQMSELLRKMPQAQAPVELFPSIMRGIERETLLPAPEATTRKLRFRHLIAIAACSLVAAVAVGSFFTNNQNVAQNDAAAPIVKGSMKVSQQLANKNQSVTGEEVKPDAKAKEFHIDAKDLAAAQPGDQISATSADGVSVIRLTVVDLKQEATALRALLAGSEIKPLKEGTEEVGNGLVAVYVRSDATKIAAAIEKMNKELGIEAMSSPVTLEASDPKVREVLAGTNDSANNTQQTVYVKTDSELDLLTRNAGSAAAANAISTDSKGPVRVIFLIVNDNKSAPKADEKKSNGAAA